LGTKVKKNTQKKTAKLGRGKITALSERNISVGEDRLAK